MLRNRYRILSYFFHYDDYKDGFGGDGVVDDDDEHDDYDVLNVKYQLLNRLNCLILKSLHLTLER